MYLPSSIGLLCLVGLAYAQRDTNLTISFSIPRTEEACLAGGPSQGITFTTSSVPTSGVCFNLTDLFGNSSSTGFKNVSNPPYTLDGGLIPDWNITYSLRNQDFNPQANYSQVWFRQVNDTGAYPGETARRQLSFYSNKDCRDVAPGTESGAEATPWFVDSCQTEDKGECRNSPLRIQSFQIGSTARLSRGTTQCKNWAYLGAANSVRQATWVVPAALLSIVVTIIFV